MPQIAEMKEIDDELWVRIPKMVGDLSVTLWTESEKKAALKAERERCMQALLDLGRQDEVGWDHEAD